MANAIHKTAVIGPHVKLLGSKIKIGPYAIIQGKTVISEDVTIASHSVIGTPPEHKDHWHEEGAGVFIMPKCTIREFTSIHSGINVMTTLGPSVIMLRGSHIGHDAVIEGSSTLSCNVMIGGHTKVMYGSNLGLGACVHQNCVIPPGSMIGMNSTVTKASVLRPFSKYAGSPVRFLGPNKKPIHDLKIDDELMEELLEDWDLANKLFAEN